MLRTSQRVADFNLKFTGRPAARRPARQTITLIQTDTGETGECGGWQCLSWHNMQTTVLRSSSLAGFWKWLLNSLVKQTVQTIINQSCKFANVVCNGQIVHQDQWVLYRICDYIRDVYKYSLQQKHGFTHIDISTWPSCLQSTSVSLTNFMTGGISCMTSLHR